MGETCGHGIYFKEHSVLFLLSVSVRHWRTRKTGPSSVARTLRGYRLKVTICPVEFSHEQNVAWSVELGLGIASPVIHGDRVFATTMRGEHTFAVLAFDAVTGKHLWRKEFDTGPLAEITPPNEHASSTPVTDGEHVYVYFSILGMIALDADDGKLIWRHELPKPFYLLAWGPANSPII